VWSPRYLPSIIMSSVGHGAAVDRQPVNMADRPQTRSQFRLDVKLEQAGHLRVAVFVPRHKPARAAQ